MAKLIIKIIVASSQVLGRAFVRAIREEIQISQQLAKQRQMHIPKEVSAAEPYKLTVKEAKQILDIQNISQDGIKTQFDKLFEANSKTKSGSFYIQSKVYRAKQRLEYEIEKMEKKKSDTTEQNKVREV